MFLHADGVAQSFADRRGLAVLAAHHADRWAGLMPRVQPDVQAAIVAMRHCDSAIDRMAAEYQVRRDALCDRVKGIGWNVQVPKAGMFVWAEIPDQWKEMGSIEFAMKLLNEGGVAVSPGRGFGSEGEGFLRMAIVENSQRLRQAVRQIDKCLDTAEATPA